MVVKKMVYLEPGQDEIVKRLAREEKTSETEIIRRAIVAYGDANAAKIAADTRRVMEHVKKYPEWDDDPANRLVRATKARVTAAQLKAERDQIARLVER